MNGQLSMEENLENQKKKKKRADDVKPTGSV